MASMVYSPSHDAGGVRATSVTTAALRCCALCGAQHPGDPGIFVIQCDHRPIGPSPFHKGTAPRRTVDPAVLEEAISTRCLLSHRRYEGRIPELAVCFGPSRRRPDRKAPAVYYGREFLASKKSAVLLKSGTLVLHCLSNGRVVEVVDLDSASSGTVSDRVLGPLDQFSTLNDSYHHRAVTVMLTRQGEVLVAMGARICFS